MCAKRFKIEKIPADVGSDEFHNRYFEPEYPVVIEGVGQTVQRFKDMSFDKVREKFVDGGEVKVNTFWFEGSAQALSPLVKTPDIVAQELKASFCRETHCRLWLNAAGNITPSHYDGNLLYVFNLQLKGRKEWRIVSPHTPLRNYPFSRAALLGNNLQNKPHALPKNAKFCNFVLEEGDMIYLPPLWHHSVKAIAEQNININWVATRKTGYVLSKTLQRERELLKFAQICYKLTGQTSLLNLALGAGIENYLENFAGVGWNFIKQQTSGINLFQVVTRILKEASMAGFVIKDLKKIRTQMKKTPLDSLKEAALAKSSNS